MGRTTSAEDASAPRTNGNIIRHIKYIRVPVIFIILTGVLLSVLVYFALQSLERKLVYAQVYQRADSYADAISFGIANSVELVDAAAAFFHASEEVTREEFSVFASMLKAPHSELRALEWVPYVRAEEQAEYEQAAQDDGFPTFHFTERSSEDLLANAGQRSEYYPVYFIEPVGGNQAAMGFDNGSSAVRKEALELARDTGQSIASGRIRLVAETGTVYGFLVFHPIYENGVSLQTTEERRSHLQGFVAGVYGVTDLIGAALKSYPIMDFAIIVEDENGQTDRRLLYARGPGISNMEEMGEDESGHIGGWADVHLDVPVPGRQWSIHFIPTPDFIASIGTSRLVYGAILPLILALGVGGFVYGIQRRRLELEDINHELNTARDEAHKELVERKAAEESLRKSEERYRTTLGDMLEGCQIVGFDYRYVYLNDAAEEQSRREREELLGRTMTEMFPGIENTEMFAILRKCMEQRKPQRLENMFTYPDGDQRCFELSFEPVSEGVFILSLDITERKQMEKHLESTNRALSVLSQCNQALIRSVEETRLLNEICRIIVEDGGYRMAWVGYALQDEQRSVRPVAWQGFEEDYLAGASISWADTERGRGPAGMAIRTGQTFVVRDIQTDPIFAPWREDARKRGYSSQISLPLVIDAKVFGVLCIYASEADAFTKDEIRLLDEMASDLAFGIATLRSRNERFTAEETLRMVFQTATCGIVVTNLSNIITDVNNRILAMYGATSKDALIGKDAIDIIVPEERAQASAKTEIVMSQGYLRNVEYVLTDSQGHKVPALVSSAVLRDNDGDPTGFVAVVEDITELRRIQEQLIAQDRLVSIGELISGVAHELNNPLTGVIGFSELLMEKEVPDDIRADLKLINSEAQRTARIVKNLLTFARQQREEKLPISVNDVIQRVLDLRAYDQKLKSITVDARTAPDLPQVLGSASQLQQVFFNIIINAEFFMIQAHNKGVLTVKTEQKGDMVCITIADDGPGISPEHIGHIFDPFYTTKGVGKGTGLGLSISHGIVTEHGGTMRAESEIGNGAKFIIEVPVYKEG